MAFVAVILGSGLGFLAMILTLLVGSGLALALTTYVLVGGVTALAILITKLFLCPMVSDHRAGPSSIT